MSEQQPKFEIRDEEQLSVDLIEAQYALKAEGNPMPKAHSF